MSLMATRQLRINLNEKKLQTINVKQFDNFSRRIVFLLSENGEQVDLSEKSVFCEMISPKRYKYTMLLDREDGLPKLTLPQSVLETAGVTKCTLIIKNSNESVVSKIPFQLNIIESIST